MPRIIRNAMLEKLRRLPEVQTFVQDFREITGIELSFRDELGRSLNPEPPQFSLCQLLASSEPGRRLCQKTRQALFAGAATEPAACRCDAGLREVAVPLRIQNTTIGFFSFYGFRTVMLEPRDQRRIQHLLAKAGVRISDVELAELNSAGKSMPEPALQAHTRMVTIAAREFARNISRQMMQPERPLPPLAHKARRFIQTHGLTDACAMREIAQACAVSAAHLSRVFHKSTGLTVTEYLARFRVEHARKLLQRREQSITEIAFASGFQSISQFNRTFKKIAGFSPTQSRSSLPRTTLRITPPKEP